MPIFEVQANGKTLEVEAPSLRAAITAVRQMGPAIGPEQPAGTPPPEFATRGQIPPSTVEGDPGYWENLGIAGAQWHPPAGPDGRIPGEGNRPDASFLGFPPELAAIAPISIGGAMAGEGLSAAGRAVAGAKAAASQAAPIIKYETTKSILEGMGAPASAATAIALAVSGYSPRRAGASRAARATRGKAPTIPEVQVAPAGAPVAAGATPAPVAPVAPAAPVTVPLSPAVSGWSPQRIRNEVGLAARREKVALSEGQLEAADALVAKQGIAPHEAVRQVATGAPEIPTAPATPAPAAAPAVSRAKMTAAESAAYLRLRKAGKTHDEAVVAVEQLRELAATLKTPSPETARQRVVERNRTGRWKP